MRWLFAAIGLAFALSFGTAQKAQAEILIDGVLCTGSCSVSFDDLTNGTVDSFTLDDKRFGSFQLIDNGFALDLAFLDLELFDNPGNLAGPGFNIDWDSTSGNIQEQLSVEFVFVFEVTVLNPALALHDIDLSFETEPVCDTTSSTVPGQVAGNCFMQERFEITSPDFAFTFLTVDQAGPLASTTNETHPPTSMGLYRILHEHTCLPGTGNGVCGFTGETMQYRFSQVQVAVPEPGSLALFGVGIAGLSLLRRRQRKAT